MAYRRCQKPASSLVCGLLGPRSTVKAGSCRAGRAEEEQAAEVRGRRREGGDGGIFCLCVSYNSSIIWDDGAVPGVGCPGEERKGKRLIREPALV